MGLRQAEHGERLGHVGGEPVGDAGEDF